MANAYMGWQMDMSDLPRTVRDALKHYYEKYGFPPQIILVSNQLEEVPIPEDMNLVIKSHRVPKNILMIGRE